jgi:hypothetical protein
VQRLAAEAQAVFEVGAGPVTNPSRDMLISATTLLTASG